jgi:hypothetical protein
MNTLSSGGAVMKFGGTPEADARAAQEAWARIDAFLGEALPP